MDDFTIDFIVESPDLLLESRYSAYGAKYGAYRDGGTAESSLPFWVDHILRALRGVRHAPWKGVYRYRSKAREHLTCSTAWTIGVFLGALQGARSRRGNDRCVGETKLQGRQHGIR